LRPWLSELLSPPLVALRADGLLWFELAGCEAGARAGRELGVVVARAGDDRSVERVAAVLGVMPVVVIRDVVVRAVLAERFVFEDCRPSPRSRGADFVAGLDGDLLVCVVL
jgi:hypothetical protein